MTTTQELTYTTVETPFGTLLLAATADGLVRIAFEREGFDRVLGELSAQLGMPASEANGELDEARRQLEEYFAGERTRFALDLDLGSIDGFRRRALEAMAAIPYGRTLTYTELAEAAGNARAVRAAGSACAANPLPIVLPCHRVLRSNGGLGGYLGGLDMKRGLLALESSPRGALSVA
jgi:methylated-DNA-[protein]-cysteine S-methyltransferase